MNLDLCGPWRLESADQAESCDVTVPGTVLSALLDAGLIDDPFVADHEFAALEKTRHDWVFSRAFDVPAAAGASGTPVLVAEGLMTLATVRLNGREVGRTDNMHRRYEWPVEGLLTPGANRVEVEFRSSLAEAEAHQRRSPTWSVNGIPGFQHVRQSHHTFGWDWGPALPDVGIFRPLRLEFRAGPRLDEVQVRQRHAAGRVALAVRLTLDAPTAAPVPLEATLTAPDGEVLRASGRVVAGQTEAVLDLTVERPQLWWPAGLGAQPLYALAVAAGESSRSLRLGLRTLTVEQNDDAWGRSFAFSANGVAFFAMGADYIPEDNLVTRRSPERTARLLRDGVAANFNCLRVWGGGYYPDDDFYDQCDELGLVVWQDLLFACALYDWTPEFRATVEAETVQNVRRLRHHACLGLWCGNNEMEQAVVEWNLGESHKDRADYLKIFEVFLPDLVGREDPDTFYWLASPSSFGGFDRPNSQDYGDMHDWSIWHGKAPFTDFRKRFPRFMSEFGLQSYPDPKTLAPCVPASERHPFSYLMELREKHSAGVFPLLHYLHQQFPIPEGFASHLRVSQLVQAEGVRYGVEHWRRNRGRCMGAVIWQLNDCWPGISWSSIDSAGRWKALHYAAKRFFAPVLLSACETGASVELHVTNDTPRAFAGSVRWTLRTRDGATLRRGRRAVSATAFSTNLVCRLAFDALLGEPPRAAASRDSFLEYELTSGSDTVSSGTCLFVPAKWFAWADPKLRVTFGPAGELTLRSRSLARGVHLDFDGFDAVFDDNDFDLPPGRPKTVRISEFRGPAPASDEALRRALTLWSLWDAFGGQKA